VFGSGKGSEGSEGPHSTGDWMGLTLAWPWAQKAHEEGNQPSQAGPSDSKPSSNYCLFCSPNEINAWRAGGPGRLAKVR